MDSAFVAWICSIYLLGFRRLEAALCTSGIYTVEVEPIMKFANRTQGALAWVHGKLDMARIHA